ncbi:GLPGLI family protein [Psychroserpens damuponensis]|uniref:GLPGLI family protein n=1 Tax=Psychroserpens damuponensis TaxID=943936 RepID=UPI00058F2735|nr:GLPGLI family protein [Psychroserpens damuponensis]
MRFFLLFITFFSQIYLFGQNNDSIPVLEYEVNYNLGKALVKKGYVFNYKKNTYYHTSKTVFLEDIEKLSIDEVTGIPNVNVFSAGDGSDFNISYKQKNEHITKHSIGYELIKTTEVLQTFIWKPTGIKKIVNGRQCVELTSYFRGRTYLALVDLSVPIDFGPWKFNSFPGLPVLIYDTENKLKWTLTNVSKESDQKIKKFILELKDYSKSLKEMTLKDFIDLYDKTNNGYDMATSKMPRDYQREKSFKKRKRGGLELKFEWEAKD